MCVHTISVLEPQDLESSYPTILLTFSSRESLTHLLQASRARDCTRPYRGTDMTHQQELMSAVLCPINSGLELIGAARVNRSQKISPVSGSYF